MTPRPGDDWARVEQLCRTKRQYKPKTCWCGGNEFRFRPHEMGPVLKIAVCVRCGSTQVLDTQPPKRIASKLRPWGGP